jgi:hypothetical protein
MKNIVFGPFKNKMGVYHASSPEPLLVEFGINRFVQIKKDAVMSNLLEASLW